VIGALGRLLRPRYVILATLLAGAWQIVGLFRPDAPSPRQASRDALRLEACRLAAVQLPALPAEGEVAVLRLAGDDTGDVTDVLRAAIDDAGLYHQQSRGAIRGLLDRLGSADRGVGDLETALEAAREREVPYALFGQVTESIIGDGLAQIRLQLGVAQVAMGAMLGEVDVSHPPIELTRDWGSMFTRAGVWLAGIILLPLLTWPLAAAILERESNAATLAGLLGYTLAAALGAVAVMEFHVAGWWEWAQIVAASVLAFGYDYAAFCLVEARRA